MTKYIEKEVKTPLNRLKQIDSWFWCRYSINPYNGCEHACIYCDGRSERYYQQKDFEETIYIKINLAKILDEKLGHSRSIEHDIVATGGVCDSYAPVELKYRNTRKILEVLCKYNFPVCLSTKNVNVEQDIPLLDEIGKRSWCATAFTITSMDPDIVNFLEPHSSPSEERLRVINVIHNKSKNIVVGINYMPIVPFLEDSDEMMNEIIKKVKEHGGNYVLFAPGLTLRDTQGMFFKSKLRAKYPELVDKFNDLVGNHKKYEKYLIEKNKILLELCKKYQIEFRLKRWIPNDYRKTNYLIAEKLLNEAYLKQIKGDYYFHLLKAGWAIQNLKESILNIEKRGELLKKLDINQKIIEKIKPDLKDDQKNTLDAFFS